VLEPGLGLAHRIFADLAELLQPGDVLVLNETEVVRARLRATRAGGTPAELLLLRPRAGPFDLAAREWLAIGRPGRALRPGARLRVGDCGVTILEALPDGPRVVRFDDDVDLAALLQTHGELPLPPYVGPGDDARAQRYQTVFARVPGSVAAPTASLHFTAALLDRIRARGVTVVPLVLDVGIGTFRPMSGTTIDEHVMHPERFAIPGETAAVIAAARRDGRRVVAAGTTVLRALEGAAAAGGQVVAGAGETALFVTPGFRFRVVDALVTNFHLPRSTLLVLVAAFAGYGRTKHAYAVAIEAGYRFFSFGDAMFVGSDQLFTPPAAEETGGASPVEKGPNA
jgi:S-adenosylmethionine:tRNA ribosyltransferase-isomerase